MIQFNPLPINYNINSQNGVNSSLPNLSLSSNTSTNSPPDKRTPLAFLYPVILASKNFIAGTFAGACESIVGHPLDTIKAKLQTQGTSMHSVKYMGTLDCLQKTIVNDGFSSLYNGVASQCARASISCSVLFGVMGYFRHLFGIDHTKEIFSWKIIAAAISTAVVETMVYTPFEVVKLRMQTMQKKTHASSWQCAKVILREHNIHGLYRGFGVTVQRESVGNVIYFGTYETIKKEFQNLRGSDEFVFSDIAVAGGIAGMVYWGGIFPWDTVKSILQSDNLATPKYRGTMECALALIKSGGIRRLYRGVSPSLIRAFPTNGIIFVSFETCVDFIEKHFSLQE